MYSKYNYIEFIDKTNPNSNQQGGKGKNLVVLHQNGIRIPMGFIIKIKAFKEYLNKISIQESVYNFLQKETDPKNVIPFTNELKSKIKFLKFPEPMFQEIKEGISILKSKFSPDTTFAIRSSASIEDQTQFSFAGQAESFCCISSLDKIISSILNCWISLFSPKSLLFMMKMKQQGKKIPKIEMAVIIQKMILSHSAGVLFTTNVLDNNPNQMLINSNWGLCETITNNSVIPDLIILNKDEFKVHKVVIGQKESLSIQVLGNSSTLMVENDISLRTSLSISEKNMKQLHELGLTIEKIFKLPQDIEWALEKDHIYVLQSRPITSLN
jgi:phosphoenolpyruvate synthase/pyruvate phosphate dikinase